MITEGGATGGGGGMTDGGGGVAAILAAIIAASARRRSIVTHSSAPTRVTSVVGLSLPICTPLRSLRKLTGLLSAWVSGSLAIQISARSSMARIIGLRGPNHTVCYLRRIVSSMSSWYTSA